MASLLFQPPAQPHALRQELATPVRLRLISFVRLAEKRKMQRRGRQLSRASYSQLHQLTTSNWFLLPSPVVHRELISRIGRKQLVDLAQPLGQRRRSQQRIVALAQLLVVHIEKQRQSVDGD